METFKKLLTELNACDSSIIWANDKSVEEVINTCHRGDWLLWLAVKMKLQHKSIILAKALCVGTIRHLIENKILLRSLDTAIKFVRGEATREDLRRAYEDAYDVEHDIFEMYSSVSNSEYYAAFAIAATCDYNTSASYAAYAAYSTSQVMYYNEDLDASKRNLQKTADICREVFGRELLETIVNVHKIGN